MTQNTTFFLVCLIQIVQCIKTFSRKHDQFLIELRRVKRRFLSYIFHLFHAENGCCKQLVLCSVHLFYLVMIMGISFFVVPGEAAVATFKGDMMERQKLSSLPSELISQECTSFLDRLHEAVEGSGILSHVHCIRDLCHIRKSVYEYMKDTSDTAEWDNLCDSVLGKRINLWEEFFRGIFWEVF